MKNLNTSEEHQGSADADNSAVSDDEGPRVICSRSYLVPGNPLAPKTKARKNRKHRNDRADSRINGCAKKSDSIMKAKHGVRDKENDDRADSRMNGCAKKSDSIMKVKHGVCGKENDDRADSRMNAGRHDKKKSAVEALREDTPSQMTRGFRLGALTPSRPENSQCPPGFLPSISKKFLPPIRHSPEHRIDDPFQRDIPEGARFIKHTHSATAFTLFYNPPHRLAPLPRHMSDNPCTSRARGNYRQRDKSHLKAYRSGGKSFSKIQAAVDDSRRARESRNMEMTMARLADLDERAARVAPVDSGTTERVRQVRARQDSIREEGHIRAMMNFMKTKK
ncbi:hypothetical protein MAR_024391 [Mya arenaria]|uniref:Uncharacterized protein n=1 Tax=Mya arenaria TaxID=6604 RepID=A0ABY7DV79_MYAAR|nr:uncharacterized protein LOC128226217 [Mya arenaria]WAR00019.1 hypothetical protein MAR_024391 [Mya arenaria]